jgi:hypothetical protein
MTTFCVDDYTVELFHDLSPQRERFETELITAGLSLPLPHRIVWAEAHPSQTSWFLGVRNGQGDPSCGFAIEVGSSRALPGHLIWRVEKFGPARNDESRKASIYGLVHYATHYKQVLRVHLNVFSRDAVVRTAAAQVAHVLGFTKTTKPRMYTDTLAISLRPNEAKIFASFHATARRHVRSAEKKAAELRVVTDPGYSMRMMELMRGTMRRTGGSAAECDWPVIIKFSQKHPELSRIIGLHQAETDGPQSLVSFAWGRFHGDHAEYAGAASTRNTSFKMPLGYAPAWDLMRWGKQQGAEWFDFGGITPGGEGDRTTGISDFKRYFGGEVISVGDEWVFEPRPVKAKIAKTVSAGTAWMRGLLTSRS